MADYKEKIDALAGLMEEFKLNEAKLTVGEFSLSFNRRPSAAKVVAVEGSTIVDEVVEFEEENEIVSAPEAPRGTPITSPMNGIFYASPSPSAPTFVKEGDTITAGQIVGLIEAMKVFNDVPSPISGTVLKVVAEPGSVVQPGDTLILIG